MNRRHFFWTLGLGAAALAARVTLARRQSGSRPPRVVTTKTNAYLIGKIEPVLTGKIREVAPAPGGRYALITQDLRPEPTDDVKEPFGEEKLWLYDALRRTTKLLHRVQDNATTQTRHTIREIMWFPEARKAVFQEMSVRMLPEGKMELSLNLGLVDVERPTVRWLASPFKQANSVFLTQAIPGTPLLIFHELSATYEPTHQFCFLSPEGNFSSVITVGEKGSVVPTGLSANGKDVVFYELIRSPREGETKLQREERWHSVRLLSTQVTPLKEKPGDMIAFNKLAPKVLPLTLHRSAAKLTSDSGRNASANPIWLEATEPGLEKKFARALVTANSDDSFSRRSQLLPDLSAVLFTHDDALYAAPIVSLDRLAFEKMMKELAMRNSKKVGLGLMMYAQDYDENFPHDPASVKGAIFPYIQNNDVLADFVYTYSGSTNLSKIEKPSETALGYIPSPGGRAVIFADGHVKWEPMPEN
ncbi:hypothetical protein [Armatimonas sp.]|uniref:hypothetical protein n=1 Tax=Armatimonas sp. TaxID=1872638 RepID=UPI003752A323